MMHKIKQWIDISEDFQDGALILGNGASIAIDSNFDYLSILEYATKEKLLNSDVKLLFEKYETKDFELILRMVWTAFEVNKAFKIEDIKTKNAYENVRDALIKSVRDIHPTYSSVEEILPDLYRFLRHFKFTFSLNYDLLVYWACMYGNNVDTEYSFKDCFNGSEFTQNWRKYLPIYKRKKSRLVFFPHGSLILGKTITEEEYKISAKNSEHNLLDNILDIWTEGKCIPLFVSEGMAKQKIKSILNSGYLSIVYRETLKEACEKVTIYGWGVSEQDIHILDAMKTPKNIIKTKFAVSVRKNNQAYCTKVKGILEEKFPNCEVTFFDSESPGCWNNSFESHKRASS
ncbi:DUF4917 family protein [Acinetobacter soli]|uniref:DUF4917 family protein n=1 Tax=Acinetobacter soli TaxID=487316 RepID=UPI001F16D187|nr:DUF4917 family protein [Acinetobacter soli]MCF3128477.1 DUF4917 family protein [Acinetobacter soli]